MKKTITIISAILLSICSTVSAATYNIQWLNLPSNTEMISPLYDSIITTTDEYFYRLCDMNGNLLREEYYYRIYPFNYDASKFYVLCRELYDRYDEDMADFIEQVNLAGHGWHNDDEEYEKAYNYCIESGREIKEDETIEIMYAQMYDNKGNHIAGYSPLDAPEDASEKILASRKLLAVGNDEKIYAVFDTEGNQLTDYEFTKHLTLYDCYAYFVLQSDNRQFIGNYDSGEWAIVDNIEAYTSASGKGLGVIEKTKDGKYVYYNQHLKKASDIEFDEYLWTYENGAAFKKDGKYYVFNNEWELAYEGEKEIKAVLYDEYVIENEYGNYGLYDSNFSEIIPPLYEYIIPVCDNVYIALRKNASDLYNQGRLVVKDMGHFPQYRNMLEVYGYIVDEYNNGMSYAYDTEGTELFQATAEDVRISTNNIDIFFESKEKGRFAKLIFKDKNPSVAINRIPLISDTVCRIKNNITLIPLRAMAEATGFNTEYMEETKEIRLTKEDKEIIFKIGDKKAVSNGVEITLNAAPEIINNRTLVPARAVSDAFGYNIDWNGERRLVEITTN